MYLKFFALLFFPFIGSGALNAIATENNNTVQNQQQKDLKSIKIPPFPDLKKKITIDKEVLSGSVHNEISINPDHGRFYDRFYLESDSNFFYQDFQRGNNNMIHLNDKIYSGTLNSTYGDEYPATYRSRVLTPTTATLDQEDSIKDSNTQYLYYKK